MALFGFTDVKIGVKQYFSSRDMRSRTVVDIPAGKGRMTIFLQSLGAEVTALDLFTHGTVVGDVTIKQADLMEPLPVPDNSIDYVLFQEGIEHLPDQLICFGEFSRILKPEGKLLVTTPNFSSFRSRLSFLFVENNSLRHFPANEIDGVVVTDAGKMCFHHLFLIGIQKLRVLAKLKGLKIKKVHPSGLSGTSLLVFILCYPIHVLFNILVYYKTRRKWTKKFRHIPMEYYGVLREILQLNLNVFVLLGNHLFVEFEKIHVTDVEGSGAMASNPPAS